MSPLEPEYQVDRFRVRISIRAMGEAWIATAEELGEGRGVTLMGINPTTLMTRLLHLASYSGFAGVRRV